MSALASYMAGRWTAPDGATVLLYDAAIGTDVAQYASGSVGAATVVDYGRRAGGE
ncbi:MAG TPA: hypothetical protein VFR17_11240 [Mycobacterium sp.]|nr:hypothetical protein [Mycobacterium sp.]